MLDVEPENKEDRMAPPNATKAQDAARGDRPIRLSVVGTLYRSADHLAEFHARASAAAAALTDDYEIVLVNDGSPDDSLHLALALQERDAHVVVVDLARNFGHHYAIMAGIEEARGDLVFLIDTDLEECPEWMSDFLEVQQRTGADVVFGVAEERIGSTFNRFAGRMAWRILDRLSRVHIPSNQATVRLMSRRYVTSLLQMQEHTLYLGAAFFWPGFVQVGHAVRKVPRRQKSTYGLLRRFSALYNAIVSFTSAPLIGVFLTGLVISGVSFLWGLALILHKLLNPQEVMSGFTSVMVSLWFIGGILILAVGIACLYIAKMYDEVKARPRYVVRHVHRSEGA